MTEREAATQADDASLKRANERLRGHPAVVAWRSRTRNTNCCDLCQEPTTTDGWRWIDEGWSLACHECITKVVALAQRPARLTRALDLLATLTTQAIQQAGPAHGEVEIDRDALQEVYDRARQLLYETRGAC